MAVSGRGPLANHWVTEENEPTTDNGMASGTHTQSMIFIHTDRVMWERGREGATLCELHIKQNQTKISQQKEMAAKENNLLHQRIANV